MQVCRKVTPSIRSIRFNPKRLTFATDWHGHLNFGSWLMEIIKPALLVELGVFRGDSLATFAQAAKELALDTKIVGVDTWEGDSTTGKYDDGVFAEVKDYFGFNHPSVVLSRQRFEQARGEFLHSSVDILHIDGCHEYYAVKDDFELWNMTLSKRGVVLFHDIEVSSPEFGTGKYWNEVKNTFPSFNFTHSNGLGVLLVGPNQPDELVHLSECDDCLSFTKAIFEASGTAHLYSDKYRWALMEKESVNQNLSDEIKRINLTKEFSIKRRISRFLLGSKRANS